MERRDIFANRRTCATCKHHRDEGCAIDAYDDDADDDEQMECFEWAPSEVTP